MEQRILINEEDLGHEVKSIKSRWQRTIITKWFLRHVLPSRIDPQTKRTTILKLKGFIRGLKIPNIDTGKLQTMRKCLHNRSKGLLGSRAVTNFLPLRTTGMSGKNDKIIANGLGLSKKHGLDSLPIMRYFITHLGTNRDKQLAPKVSFCSEGDSKVPPQLYLSRHEDDTCRIFHEEEKLVSDSAGDAATQTLKTYTKNIQAGVVTRASRHNLSQTQGHLLREAKMKEICLKHNPDMAQDMKTDPFYLKPQLLTWLLIPDQYKILRSIFYR